jgi:hypothetical protein
MTHHPPACLTADQIRSILMFRGIAVADEDLAELPALAGALRQQADGLLETLHDDAARHGDLGELHELGGPE